ncbi:MAG: OmpA family protein [Pseudomonadota bacterium]
MSAKLKLILIASTALGLAACSSPSSREAGALLDEGDFGGPTLTNQLLQTGQLSAVVDLNKRFSSEVPTMVNFAFDSAVLDGAARATLRQQADWIKQFPEVKFRVYGHTDLVGPDAYNRALGLRRARAVVNFLVSQGISRSRLEAVTSFGETQPLVVTENREPRNRRTVTEVSGFLGNTPTLLNGKYATVIFREYVPSATEIPSDGGVETTIAEGG